MKVLNKVDMKVSFRTPITAVGGGGPSCEKKLERSKRIRSGRGREGGVRNHPEVKNYEQEEED